MASGERGGADGITGFANAFQTMGDTGGGGGAVSPEDIVMAATASSFDTAASRRVATSTSVATAEASSRTVQAALRASVAAAQRLQRQGTYVCVCVCGSADGIVCVSGVLGRIELPSPRHGRDLEEAESLLPVSAGLECEGHQCELAHMSGMGCVVFCSGVGAGLAAVGAVHLTARAGHR